MAAEFPQAASFAEVQRTNWNWGGRTRTSNFLINSQAVCQLTYAPPNTRKSNDAPLLLDAPARDFVTRTRPERLSRCVAPPRGRHASPARPGRGTQPAPRRS